MRFIARLRLVPRALFITAFVGIAAVASTQANAYTNLYVFGDSLSDSGNVFTQTSPGGGFPLPTPIPGPDYFQGRFSNGYNYADVLSQKLRGTPAVSFSQGGNNFAFGGATTGFENAVLSGPGIPPTGLRAQLAMYETKHGTVADPNALYLVYGGSNDMISALAQAAIDPLNGQTIVENAITTAATNLGVIFQTLAAEGAQHFLVPNLPDLGKTPRALSLGAGASSFATQASVGFNQALSQVLAGLTLAGLDVRPVDVFGTLNAAIADPGAFGFDPALTGTACFTGTPFSPGVACAAADQSKYIFWDDIHPTGAAHAFLGEAAFAAAVPEAQAWALMIAGLALLGFVVRAKRSV